MTVVAVAAVVDAVVALVRIFGMHHGCGGGVSDLMQH
jgi:hypothetical protein